MFSALALRCSMSETHIKQAALDISRQHSPRTNGAPSPVSTGTVYALKLYVRMCVALVVLHCHV